MKTDDELDERWDAVRQLTSQWAARVQAEPAEVETNSDLAADDAATSYMHSSHMIQTSLHVAVDHLQALVALISDAKFLAAYGTLTLIRGAIESAATAVWVLAPQDGQERVRRRLALAMGDAKYRGDLDAFITGTSTQAEREQEVLDIAACSGLSRSELRSAGYEALVTAAGDALGDGKVYRVAWKGASGAAHGRQWASVSLMRLTPHGDPRDDGTQTVGVSVELETVVNAAVIATNLLNGAWQLFDRRRSA